MAKAPVLLTSLSEEQRAEAYARFEMLRPALEEGVSQAQIARTHQLSKSAVQRWVTRYREQGLVGLVTTARKDKGKSRRSPQRSLFVKPSGAKKILDGQLVASPASSTPTMALTSPVNIWSRSRQISVWS